MYSKKISSSVDSLRLLLLTMVLCTFGVTIASAQSPTFKRPKIAKSGPYVNSDILVSSGFHTVVPKHAVICVPENMSHRLSSSPQGKFIIWPKFLKKNYGWIHKHEVTLNQASGKTPISEQKLESLKAMGKVVVAVYKNGPISVLAPKATKK